VLDYNGVIATAQVAPYGVFAFMFSQAFLLSSRFAAAFPAVERQAAELREMYQASDRFVPHQFLGFLGRGSIIEVEAGDHVNATRSVLFADIRSFTAISEAMSPDDNFRFLNSYLEHMEPAIRGNGGFIDKYVGDAIMALCEVFDADEESLRAAKRATVTQFDEGIELFYQQRFAQAAERFTACLVRDARDGAAARHLERCQHYQRVGWGERWDGYTRLEDK